VGAVIVVGLIKVIVILVDVIVCVISSSAAAAELVIQIVADMPCYNEVEVTHLS